MKKRNRLFLANKAQEKKCKGLKLGQARITGKSKMRHHYLLGVVVEVLAIEGNLVKCGANDSSYYQGYYQWVHKDDLVIR